MATWHAMGAPTLSRLRRLIRRHRGNLTAMAAEFAPQITRQGVAWHLQRLGLLDEAAAARAGAGVKGPRLMLDGSSAEVPGERDMIAAVLAVASSRLNASAALGLSRRTLYRKLHQHGLI